MLLKRAFSQGAAALPNFVNRNPRNLERMTIAYKPSGYHLEKPGRSYWHKLELEVGGKHVTAKVVHYVNGPVVEASTKEWAIKKHLYSTKDTNAFVNLGRVLARRCLRFGIEEMSCTLEVTPGSKSHKFMDALREGGVSLEESSRYIAPFPWSQHRPEKPWDVKE